MFRPDGGVGPWIFGIGLWLLGAFTEVQAVEVSDELSLNLTAAAVVQSQRVNNASNETRADGYFETELYYQPTASDTIAVKARFASGNALNNVSPFLLAPWATELEDDLEDINGRSRDYLLTAWYRHEWEFSGESLSITMGLIDATDFLDVNRFANDETTQFLNQSLANAPDMIVPSYDIGAAVQWQHGSWSINGLAMQVGDDLAGDEYLYSGVQLGYRAELATGERNYRLLLGVTSSDFPDAQGGGRERRLEAVLSLDQDLTETLGVFVRAGWQNDDVGIDVESLLSAGVEIGGAGWKRGGDRIGLAGAYLSGGNFDLDESWLAEAYYRWQVAEDFAVTFDLQYLEDELSGARDPSGFVFGIRFVIER